VTEAAAGAEAAPQPIPGGPTVRNLPVLSYLLLVTGLGLLLLLAMRAPGLIAQAGSVLGVQAVAVPASAPMFAAPPSAADIEPAAGPAMAGPPPEPRRTAAPKPAAEVEVLEALAAELHRYQAALEERERAIVLRETVVTTVEKRVRAQIGQLDGLKGEVERLLGQLSADEQARVAQLVKVYEAMKAKSAAMIFDPMALELLLPIMRGMRETKVAAIVAEMDPAKARALTAELAKPHEPIQPVPTTTH